MTERTRVGMMDRLRAIGESARGWLSPRRQDRPASARSRWVQAILTAGLLLTGLSAWAVALVQPWSGRQGDLGVVFVAGGFDAERVRSAATDVEELLAEKPAAEPKALRRNPFVPAQAPAGAAMAASASVRPAETPVPAARLTAKDVLATVKTLKLEITIITPEGDRWAVINGENYREGNAIAGLELVEIQDGKVKLQHGGITCLLRMD